MFASNSGAVVRTGGRSRVRRFLFAALTAAVLAAGPATARAQDGSVAVSEEAGLYRVTSTFAVPEPTGLVLATLTDYAQIPRFMPEVRMSQVLERTDDRTVVEQEAVATFMLFSKRLHLVLEVQTMRGQIRFHDRCGRSFERYDGAWTIAEQPGHSRITYELSAKPSFDVPRFVLKRLLKRDAAQMIERLKIEIAARARQRVN